MVDSNTIHGFGQDVRKGITGKFDRLKIGNIYIQSF